MKYGVTRKKIVHIIRENSTNGMGGYWDTACGKWICPVKFLDALSGVEKMCICCKKREEARGDD